MFNVEVSLGHFCFLI